MRKRTRGRGLGGPRSSPDPQAKFDSDLDRRTDGLGRTQKTRVFVRTSDVRLTSEVRQLDLDPAQMGSFTLREAAMTQNPRLLPRTATVDEFREDPSAVVDQAFEYGEVVVIGDAREDGVRFVAQSYDIELE